MQNLNDDYKERLQAVAEVIQGSDELAAYLDEESPELYKVLQDTYEPLVQRSTKKSQRMIHCKLKHSKMYY